MIFKQIHSLPTGPNWGKIALTTVGIIAVGFIAYQVFKPFKIKIEPRSKPKPGDKTE
ncbi:MAG: hypothetical protein ACK50A_03295 [Sphingobacteriaceae bacterium]|jgi:uncharacterized membrane protein YebE (DUF533 family)